MKTIKELRLERGLTLQNIVDKLELGDATKRGYVSSIFRLEAGTQVPTVARLERILEALGYKMEIYAIDGNKRIPLRLTHSRAKDTGDPTIPDTNQPTKD